MALALDAHVIQQTLRCGDLRLLCVDALAQLAQGRVAFAQLL